MHATTDRPFCENLQHSVAPMALVHMLFSVGLIPILKVNPLGEGTSAHAPHSTWVSTSYRATAVPNISSISKHNTSRRSWNADKNTKWIWELLWISRGSNCQDIFSDVSLLSDACFGGTWSLQQLNTALVTRWALGSSSAPSLHGSYG